MAQLPFTRPEEVPISHNHTNHQLPAKLDTIKTAPDVPLAQAPYTAYTPLPPEPRYKGKLPMPQHLFTDGVWDRIVGISAFVQVELRRAYDKVKKLRASSNPQPGEVAFDYNALNAWCGGKGSDGLTIEDSDFVEKYRPWTALVYPCGSLRYTLVLYQFLWKYGTCMFSCAHYGEPPSKTGCSIM
jgi:hypothetical protein